MRLQVSWCIERGKGKDACEDTALAGRRVIGESCGSVEIEAPGWVCLCDGVGGNAGERDASRFVCNALAGSEAPGSKDEIRERFAGLNAKLLDYARQTEDKKEMGTTATVLYISENSILLAHVGNTRLYFKRWLYLQQITEDQTTYQWFLNNGFYKEAESCNREEIRGAMGAGSPGFLETMVTDEIRAMPSAILLTSDGVHEFVKLYQLEEIMNTEKSAPEKAKATCSAALAQGSEDDRSAVIIEIR